MRIARQRPIVFQAVAGLVMVAIVGMVIVAGRIVAFGSGPNAFTGSRASGRLCHASGMKGMANARKSASGELFVQLSDEYLGYDREAPVATTELASLYWCAAQAPEFEIGMRSQMRLNALMSTVDLADLSTAISSSGASANQHLRPIGSGLLARIQAEPGHPQAARLLSMVCAMTHNDHEDVEPGAVFSSAADLIALRHANSGDIGGFIDCLAVEGAGPRWGCVFETHLSTILKANPHAAVQCRVLYAQACLARRNGREGAARAAALLHQLIMKFDGPEAPTLGAAEKKLLQRAHALHAELTAAVVGRLPPEIVGLEIAGCPTRLTGHRG
jgi:hypothetical protein